MDYTWNSLVTFISLQSILQALVGVETLQNVLLYLLSHMLKCF